MLWSIIAKIIAIISAFFNYKLSLSEKRSEKKLWITITFAIVLLGIIIGAILDISESNNLKSANDALSMQNDTLIEQNGNLIENKNTLIDKIDSLKAQIIELGGNLDKKIISNENREKMIEILKSGKGSEIRIFDEKSIPETEKLKKELIVVFRGAGWNIALGDAIGSAIGPKKDFLEFRKENGWKADLIIEALKIVNIDLEKDESNSRSIGNTIELNLVIFHEEYN
jgi:hypothetical protein